MVEQNHVTFVNPNPEVTPSQGDIDTCVHHWMIEAQKGAISNGTCKNCGEEKPFRNSTDEHDWRGYKTSRFDVTSEETNRGTPVQFKIPVFKNPVQLGGKRIA